MIPGAGLGQNFSLVAPLTDGSAWVTVSSVRGPGGLKHFLNGKWTAFHTKNWNGEGGAYGLLLDRSRTLWVGTGGRGLYRIRDGRADHFGSAEGLSSDNVGRMFEDHEGIYGSHQ